MHEARKVSEQGSMLFQNTQKFATFIIDRLSERFKRSLYYTIIWTERMIQTMLEIYYFLEMMFSLQDKARDKQSTK